MSDWWLQSAPILVVLWLLWCGYIIPTWVRLERDHAEIDDIKAEVERLADPEWRACWAEAWAELEVLEHPERVLEQPKPRRLTPSAVKTYIITQAPRVRCWAEHEPPDQLQYEVATRRRWG